MCTCGVSCALRCVSCVQKINQKNSWSLDLIDHIDDVLQSNFNNEEGSGVGNFQAASCTLDASVKIYSYRVDSIHNETYRVLGDLSLTRNGKKSKRAHPSLVLRDERVHHASPCVAGMTFSTS